MTSKYEGMTIEELEALRAGKLAEIEAARAEFMEAGRALNALLHHSDLTAQKADLERRTAEVEQKLQNLGG